MGTPMRDKVIVGAIAVALAGVLLTVLRGRKAIRSSVARDQPAGADHEGATVAPLQSTMPDEPVALVPADVDSVDVEPPELALGPGGYELHPPGTKARPQMALIVLVGIGAPMWLGSVLVPDNGPGAMLLACLIWLGEAIVYLLYRHATSDVHPGYQVISALVGAPILVIGVILLLAPGGSMLIPALALIAFGGVIVIRGGALVARATGDTAGALADRTVGVLIRTVFSWAFLGGLLFILLTQLISLVVAELTR